MADWTYVGDIVNGLLAAGVRKEAIGEAINLGSGTETRVIDSQQGQPAYRKRSWYLVYRSKGLGRKNADYFID
jgi:nucleoside-diphosphate-sugar epimerase